MKNSAKTLAKRNELRKHWRDTISPDSFPSFIVRICADCKQEKPCLWNSSFTQTGQPEYRNRCQDCFRSRENDRNKGNRTRLTTRAVDRRQARKSRCVAYLGGRCVKCGYDRCVKAMNFHHRDPQTKSFEVSAKLDYSWAALKAELDKCDLLCFNCHMEEHCHEDRGTRTALDAPTRPGTCMHYEGALHDGTDRPGPALMGIHS